MGNKIHLPAIMNGEQEKPSIIAFEVTRKCRFDCRHCRASACEDENAKELTTEQCKKILEAISRFSKCMVIFTGGEPMERDDIYELIRHSRELGLRPVMATCGYAINEESITKLKEAGVVALSFSLDGASALTNDTFKQAEGAFDFAIEAARIARKAGVRFQINSTISKVNIDESAGIAELAKRLGADCFNVFILVPTGRARELWDEILDPVEYEALLNDLLEMKLESGIEVRATCGPQFARVCQQDDRRELINSVNGCMGGRGFGFINWRGDVQTCGFLDVSAGNLIESDFDFAKIWTESKFLNEIRNVSDYKGECGICKYLRICGGCRARAFAMSGDYLTADPVCSYGAGGKG